MTAVLASDILKEFFSFLGKTDGSAIVYGAPRLKDLGDVILETFFLVNFEVDPLVGKDYYHPILFGISKLLLELMPHLEASKLDFTRHPANQIEKRRRQCQLLRTVLKTLSPPVLASVDEMLNPNNDSMKDMTVWVVQMKLYTLIERTEVGRLLGTFFDEDHPDMDDSLQDFTRLFENINPAIQSPTFNTYKEVKNLRGDAIFEKYVTFLVKQKSPMVRELFRNRASRNSSFDDYWKKEPDNMRFLREEIVRIIDFYCFGMRMDLLSNAAIAEATAFLQRRKMRELFVEEINDFPFDKELFQNSIENLEDDERKTELFVRGIKEDIDVSIAIYQKTQDIENERPEFKTDPANQALNQRLHEKNRKLGDILAATANMYFNTSEALRESSETMLRPVKVKDFDLDEYTRTRTVIESYTLLSSLLKQSIVDVKKMPIKNKRQEVYRNIYECFANDVRIHLRDWFWKSELTKYHRYSIEDNMYEMKDDVMAKRHEEAEFERNFKQVKINNNIYKENKKILSELSDRLANVRMEYELETAIAW